MLQALPHLRRAARCARVRLHLTTTKKNRAMLSTTTTMCMGCDMRAFCARCGIPTLNVFDVYSLGLAGLVAQSTKQWTDGVLVLLAYGFAKTHMESRRHAIEQLDQEDDPQPPSPLFNVSPSNAPPETRPANYGPLDMNDMALFPQPRMPINRLGFPTLGYSPSNQALPWYARQVRSPTIQWRPRMNFANGPRYT